MVLRQLAQLKRERSLKREQQPLRNTDKFGNEEQFMICKDVKTAFMYVRAQFKVLFSISIYVYIIELKLRVQSW